MTVPTLDHFGEILGPTRLAETHLTECYNWPKKYHYIQKGIKTILNYRSIEQDPSFLCKKAPYTEKNDPIDFCVTLKTFTAQ